jgi:hypothetical protein
VVLAGLSADQTPTAGYGGPGRSSTSRPAARSATSKTRIIARRGAQARNIAKTAAARSLLTAVFYAVRDGQAKSLAARTAAKAAT